MAAVARKQLHLAAQLPGIHNVTVWSDPRSWSQIAIDSFVRLAQTAERGKFDFFFLAEGLRLREHEGEFYELDVVGRPENLTVLAALSAVTSRLGLAATVNATFNEPYEVARRLATVDHLSGGRAAWNVVTSFDTFTGDAHRAVPRRHRHRDPRPRRRGPCRMAPADLRTRRRRRPLRPPYDSAGVAAAPDGCRPVGGSSARAHREASQCRSTSCLPGAE